MAHNGKRFSPKIIALLSVACGFLISCGAPSPTYTDVTSDNRGEVLQVPAGDYGSVAWLTANQIAFIYSEDIDDRIQLFDLETEEWNSVVIPQPEQCDSFHLNRLSRLPNGDLGYLFTCHIWEPPSDQTSLYKWHRSADTFQVLQHYPKQFWPGYYTFSPDMTQLFQETNGGGTDEKLYQVTQDSQLEQRFADWARAGTPSWSPDSKTIAFAGTEAGPKPKSSIFTGLVGIGNALFHPWDLYLMDADSSNLRIILSNIKLLAVVKWSPAGRLLAFRGEYQEKEGVWVLDTERGQLTRLWADIPLTYDWSPDGRQIVILQREEQEGLERYYPVIVEVPPISE